MTGYANIFKRAVADPMSVTDEELNQLSDDDRALVVMRIERECEEIDNVLRRRAGVAHVASAHRLSEARLEELCAAARKPGFMFTSVPLDEYTLLCANPDQHAVFESAFAEGFDAGGGV
jgi:hypothetical protein